MTDIPCDDQPIRDITPDQAAAVRWLLATVGALDLAEMLLGEGA